MWVGLTGNIGSGKSTVANLFNQYEDVVIHNSDDLAKKVISIPDGQEFLRNAFGEEYLDFKKLSELVFNDDNSLKLLEEYSHPIVCSWLKKNYKKNKINLLESAILFEKGLNKWCDEVIYVSSSMQRQRLYDKGLNDEEINVRLKKQLSICTMTKVKMSTYHIDNSLDLDSLSKTVEKIYNKIKEEE